MIGCCVILTGDVEDVTCHLHVSTSEANDAAPCELASSVLRWNLHLTSLALKDALETKFVTSNQLRGERVGVACSRLECSGTACKGTDGFDVFNVELSKPTITGW